MVQLKLSEFFLHSCQEFSEQQMYNPNQNESPKKFYFLMFEINALLYSRAEDEGFATLKNVEI